VRFSLLPAFLTTRVRLARRSASFHECSEGEPCLIVLESTSKQLDIPYGALLRMHLTRLRPHVRI
jgi:hypothetical protein